MVPASGQFTNKKIKKNNTHIKRPLNSFMIWSSFRRSQISTTESKINNSQISKILGTEWFNLPEKDKIYYKTQAYEIKQKHMKLYPDYKYSPIFKDKSKDKSKAKNRYTNKKKIQYIVQEDNTIYLEQSISLLLDSVDVPTTPVFEDINSIYNDTNTIMEHIFDMIDYKHYLF